MRALVYLYEIVGVKSFYIWQKFEQMLLIEILKKTYPPEIEQIISLSIKLGVHNCKNEEIWSGILMDFESNLD